MLNPDYIPFEWGVPLALILWIVLFFLWWADHRKLKKALKTRPALKVLNHDTGDWDPVAGVPITKPMARRDIRPRQAVTHKAVSNFYDHEKDAAV